MLACSFESRDHDIICMANKTQPHWRCLYICCISNYRTQLQVESDHNVKADGGPMLTVELQLNSAEACFEPWLVGTSKPSVKQLLEAWVQGCLDCSHLVTQVQTGTGG